MKENNGFAEFNKNRPRTSYLIAATTIDTVTTAPQLEFAIPAIQIKNRINVANPPNVRPTIAPVERPPFDFAGIGGASYMVTVASRRWPLDSTSVYSVQVQSVQLLSQRMEWEVPLVWRRRAASRRKGWGKLEERERTSLWRLLI
jgi:hypothetical protein